MRTLLSVTLGILWLCVPAQAADKSLIIYRASEITFASSVVMDWASGATLDKEKFYEANPVLTNNLGVQALIMGGVSTVTWYCTRRLYNTGHKKKAILLLLGSAAAHGWAAHHNFTLEGR